MAKLEEYTVVANGVEVTVQLSEDALKHYPGAKKVTTAKAQTKTTKK